MSQMTIPDLVNAVLALAALGLSVLSLYLQRRDKRPCLKVTAVLDRKSLPLKRDNQGGFTHVEVPALSVQVRNPGEKEVRLARCFLTYRGLIAELRPVHARFGVIVPGESQGFAFRGQDIVGALFRNTTRRKMRARVIVKDELENVLRGPRLTFRVDALTDPY